MAIHRSTRKAAHLPVQAARRARQAIEGRRAHRGIARNSDADRGDRRLHEIAAEVRADAVYSVPWELFRFVALRQAPHKQAAVVLARWCASTGLTPRLEARTVTLGEPAPSYLPVALKGEVRYHRCEAPELGTWGEASG